VHAFADRPAQLNRDVATGCVAGVLLCLLFPFTVQTVFAGALEDSLQNPRVEQIVTTGVRDRPLASLARSATIITADDIALLPSSNIVDLLAREANLNLRSVAGNAKFSGVDIRGQGDTYSSNVLVLVDGVALNAADLSGADYSAVPLEQIERIEVIRGANTVRYGSGAVGGVINIITKDAGAGTRIDAQARTGSYASVETGLGAGWVGEQASLAVDGAYQDSDGYRDNSGLETKDVAAEAGYQPVEWLDLGVRGTWHRDDYGLPGPVSYDAFNGSDSDRTATATPFDGGETDDDRVRLDVALGTADTGVLQLLGSLRNRDNRYGIGLDAPVPEPDEISEYETRLEMQYDKSLQLWQRTHGFTLGVDLVDTDYSRDQYFPDGRFTDSRVGDIRQTAWFAAMDLGLTDTTTLSFGYREDEFRVSGGTYILDCAEEDKSDFADELPIPLPNPVCIPDAPVFMQPDETGTHRNSWRNSAAELGLVYSASDTTSLFVSYAQSFRNPNVDELIVADDNLSPQTGDHIDAGIRQQIGNVLEWNFALFYSQTDDEILFGINPEDNTSVNRNADETTERVGGEADVRWYVIPSLTLTANLGYTHAEFEETGTMVPLVPEWTGAVSALWQPGPGWVWTVAGNYVGERFDGNDFGNQKPRLDEYFVADTRLSYQRAGMQFYAGVNNLFDEVYAASAYSNRYYPMPDRNYYAGIAYRINN
jgi:outer membrane receptor protein involved in Fe transport